MQKRPTYRIIENTENSNSPNQDKIVVKLREKLRLSEMRQKEMEVLQQEILQQFHLEQKNQHRQQLEKLTE